jgi:hypothetical protein
VSSKGGSSAGGSSSSSAKSSSAGGSGGVSTYPSVGGATGGTSVKGGSSGAGGNTAGTTGTSETPPPTDSLAAYVAQKLTGSAGQMGFAFTVNNTTDKSVDISGVTLRYWYQDEGLTSPMVEIDYASIGKISGAAVAAPSPAAGADHYLELTFTGVTLAAKGATSGNDQLKTNGRLHTQNYQGAVVDVSNDYSYNGGTVGYDKLITLHDKTGKVIAGTPPSGGSTPVRSPDAGSADANAAH